MYSAELDLDLYLGSNFIVTLQVYDSILPMRIQEEDKIEFTIMVDSSNPHFTNGEQHFLGENTDGEIMYVNHNGDASAEEYRFSALSGGGIDISREADKGSPDGYETYFDGMVKIFIPGSEFSNKDGFVWKNAAKYRDIPLYRYKLEIGGVRFLSGYLNIRI